MKGKSTRRVASGTSAALAVLLLAAGAAWACTAQPRIFSLGPQVGPVGLEIKLEGQTVGAAPVEVRWNSLEGAKVGEATADFNGNFSVPVKIPDVEPGIYFLVVRTRDSGVVQTPFEVTSERPVGERRHAGNSRAASSADLWSAFSGGSGQADQALTASSEKDSGSGIQALVGGALFAAGAIALASLIVLGRRRNALAE